MSKDSSHPRRRRRFGALPMPLPLELALTTLKNLANFLLNAGRGLASPIYILARIAERCRLRTIAAALYAKALALADVSRSRSMFRVRHLWEFLSERNLARMGRPQVEDPLFKATASPDPAHVLHGRARREAPGFYQARFTHRGLRIDGYLRPGMGQVRIDVLVDGHVLRTTTPTMLPLGLPFFVIGIWREALSMLPASGRLELRLTTGEPLAHHGSAVTLLELPQGLSAEGAWQQPVAIDKKGFLVKGSVDVAALQQGFLHIYQRASEFFDQHLGTPLFVLYGTLLGQHRGQDYIPGDDDFDVGYYSDATTSEAVRREGMGFVVALVKAGFVVTLNRGGRLFRLRLPDMPPACHLDVHAVWRERGSLWIHPFANLDCQREDFLPTHPAAFHDREVSVPAKPEAFLAAYYGADWRVPNPAYSTNARHFPRWKQLHLARSLVNPVLLQEMQRQIEQSTAVEGRTGMLLAIGMQSIYPLERYKALCDW